MPDFNKVLETGDYQNGLLNVVNEIPKGSTLKIEWDRERAAFTLDRVEPAIYAKPVNYGFIPKTLDEDGDELDVLIVTDEPIPTGVWLKTRILGVLNFVDDGENDHKVVVVPEDDRNSGGKFQTLEDLGEQYLKQLEEHFKHYKDLKKPGSTVVNGWGNIEDAKKIVSECVDRFNNK
ncbi:MAG: inorganic diphosphatase [bacterium]|jgi:inorganic pyrophosphatase|nr:inorganic diphosphatase [bacterium]